MGGYELDQRILALSTIFDVRLLGADGQGDPIMRIEGDFSSTRPRFNLMSVSGETNGWQLVGNLQKTNYTIQEGAVVKAQIEFPMVAIKKTLTLTMVGGEKYRADGGVFMGIFRLASEGGTVPFEIIRRAGLREGLVLMFKEDETAWREIGLLAAVAIHSRFFGLV